MEDDSRLVESLVCSFAVNERTLLILAALGASVVAYAVYALLTRSMVEQPAPAAASVTAPAEAEDEPRPAPPRRSKDRATPPAPRPQVARMPPQTADDPAGGPPPTLPKPSVTLEEAREDYDAFVEELERELQRNEETGKPLANEHWVEYYARTHEVMDPLRYYLSFGTDAQKKEVGDLDEALRTLMSDLQKDPTTED